VRHEDVGGRVDVGPSGLEESDIFMGSDTFDVVQQVARAWPAPWLWGIVPLCPSHPGWL
jgi:hypothetical protein